MEIDRKEKFNKLITDLQGSSQSLNYFKKPSNDKVMIRPDDFDLLSKYEKNTIKTIANIYGIISSNEEVTYDTLMQIVNRLSHRGDIEKHYLLALFFPEKIKNIHTIYPFPIPTYTFSQKFQVFVTPNSNGCFLTQAICPLLLDNTQVTVDAINNYVNGNKGITTPPIYNGNILSERDGTVDSQTGSISNLYVNNHANLDGTTLGQPEHFTPITVTQTLPGAFNAYVLQACKISAKYVGRGDVQSGYFGAAYHLSPESSKKPDINPTQFDFVDDSINGVVADVTDGINAVYYPPDYSYMNFLQVNKDNVSVNTMSTNLRLNIYGASLPPPNVDGGNNTSAGVILSFVVVWNVIPTPSYSDLLPLDYNLEEQNFDLLETSKFVPQSKLNTFKNSEVGEIERMLELPSNIRKNAIDDLYSLPDKGKRNTVLDVLKPLTGSTIPKQIKLDRNLITQLVNSGLSSNRKDQVDKFNELISGSR